MKTYAVPHSDLVVPSVVLGLMRIAKMSDGEIRALFDAAVESGVTMIDHADVYGGAPHVCEARFGEAVKLSATDRGRIMIQSKAGIRPGYFDFSSEHILEAVDGSLKALRTDYLDVLLLHRPDTLVEPEEVAKAFDSAARGRQGAPFRRLQPDAGTDRAAQVGGDASRCCSTRCSSASPMPTSSRRASRPTWTGSTSRSRATSGCSTIRRLNGHDAAGVVAVPEGLLRRRVHRRPQGIRRTQRRARRAGRRNTRVTPTGIAVAWITRHPANMQVVLGTTKPDRVRESAGGSESSSRARSGIGCSVPRGTSCRKEDWPLAIRALLRLSATTHSQRAMPDPRMAAQ